MEFIGTEAYRLVGITGFIAYFLSYFLLQTGHITGAGLPHTLLNLAAASLVLISLIQDFNLASALIQISWILISIMGLCRIARRKRRRNTTMTSKSITQMG